MKSFNHFILLTIAPLLLLTGCKDKPYARSFYSCCETLCDDGKHLLKEEFFNANNQVTRITIYSPEFPTPVHYLRYVYSGDRLTQFVDSSELYRREVRYQYNEKKKMTGQAHLLARMTVINTIMDTILHSGWHQQPDTLQYLYFYEDKLLSHGVEIQQNDTLSHIRYYYDDKRRLSEIRKETKLTRFFYNAVDSLQRKEEWMLTNSSANVNDFQPRHAVWRLFTYSEYTYDPSGRKSGMTFIEEASDFTIEEKYFYDTNGRLTRIYYNNECQEVVYKKM